MIDGGWSEQDEIVDRLVSHFEAWTGTPPRVVDRRVRPSHGYRAVHVIVFPDGIPVEIQVRTELQNYWAQVVERLADRWGRGIRYGDEPENAYLPAEGVRYPDGSPVSREAVINDLREVSREIAALEMTEREMASYAMRQPVTLKEKMTRILQRDVTDCDKDAGAFYARFRKIFKKFVTELARRNDSTGLRFGRTARHGRRLAGRIIRRTVPDIPAADAAFVDTRLLKCDEFVDDVADVLRSRLKNQQVALRATLQRLTEYVDEGGIR